MNTTKFLKIIIALLLLINISTVAFMWFIKPERRDDIGGFFNKELHFTKQQQQQFETLRDEHRKDRESLKEANKKAHDNYFNLLKNQTVDSVAIKNDIAEILKIKQKEELLTFNHFRKVRAICDDNQKKKFDEIINQAARMMAPNPPHDGHRPPRGEDRPPR